jgi:rhodanese-related sulfurtransferase
VQDIFSGEVALWLRRGVKAIDVQGPEEHAGGHLPGAVNLPLACLTLARLTLVPERRAAPLVVVCASGVRRARAARLPEEAGHPDVAHLLGGTVGWLGEQRPLELPCPDAD